MLTSMQPLRREGALRPSLSRRGNMVNCSRALARAVAVPLTMAVCAASLVAQQSSAQLDRAKLGKLLSNKALTTPVSVVGAGGTHAIADTVHAFRLSPRQYLAAVVAKTARRDTTHGVARLNLPIRYVRPDASGERAALHLIPAAEVEGGGLEYAPGQDVFRGSVLIGLEDSVNPARRESLNPPIRFQLTSDAGTVAPNQLVLRFTNIPFVEVALESRTPRDSITVRVRPEFTNEVVSFRVPVRRPALQLEVSPKKIQGFGLEVATLTAIVPREAGNAPRTVTFESDRGAPTATSVAVGREGTAVTTLRSRGVGAAAVTVRSTQLMSVTQPVDFQWPIAFLVAALLGSALGTVAARARARRRKTPHSVAQSSAVGASGFVIGLITAIAYAVGVNLTGLDITTQYGEGLVVVLAALGAIYGLPGLSRTVPALRRLSGAHPSK